MDIKERGKKQRNWIEKGLNNIPGFKGYYNRELRRDSDKLQRDFIVLKLNEIMGEFKKLIKKVTRESDLGRLTDYGDLLKYFEKVINNIKYSDRGYTGFFDLIKIREAELDVIYEKDVEIVEEVLGLKNDFHNIEDILSDQDKIDKIRSALESIEKSYEKRNEILRGFDVG